MNNEWNSGQASPPYSEVIFTGDTNGGTYFGWQWSWNNANTWTVLSYPEVLCGQSPWSPSLIHSSGFPFAIGSTNVKSTFNIIQTINESLSRGNTYDLAYDIWVISNTSDTNNFTSTNIKCEIMIWLASERCEPDGVTPTTFIPANGISWGYVMKTGQGGSPHGWTYAAYDAVTPVFDSPAGGFDITPFLSDLVSRGVIVNGDYVATVELGTEVAIGAGMVFISNYSVILY